MIGVNRFNLRLPETLRDAVENRAEMHLRSVNNEILVLIKMGLVNETEETKALTMANKLITRTKTEKRAKSNS